MKQYYLFFSNFLKDPKSVGAVVPLSQNVTKQLVKHFNNRNPKESSRILEVGAGIGNVTRSIVKCLTPQDHFDIVEIDPSCCQLLHRAFGDDPRLSIHCMSILDWQPTETYDFIISTLPLNSFNPKFVEEIFLHYQKFLKPNGVLTYVEYMGLQQISLAFSKGMKREVISKRISLLKEMHNRYLFEKKPVFSNFLPCHVYHMNMDASGKPLPITQKKRKFKKDK